MGDEISSLALEQAVMAASVMVIHSKHSHPKSLFFVSIFLIVLMVNNKICGKYRKKRQKKTRILQKEGVSKLAHPHFMLP
jgi:uncharacterized membrane protein